MKKAIRIFIGLKILLNIIKFTSSSQFDSVFLEEVYELSVNDCLIIKTITNSLHECLVQCLIETECLHANFEGNTCSLLTFISKKNTCSSNSKTVYKKINSESNEVLKKNLSQTELNTVCSNSSLFWSIKTNSCLSCKPGFQKYIQVPYLCYHSQFSPKNFIESKVYCQSKNATLFEPKSENERIFFNENFSCKKAYVNSVINNIGETFKWPNGSNVIGFDQRQPNNQNSKSDLKENCLEIRPNSYFNDISCDRKLTLTICQHD
ncbi:unnamed protein product [Brachionus calyciflorus]|uniref:C-type lectin domain-containing protein n=1 Tax=Brachionus calyciflorus TaxID=104777 RepID=A0A813VR45_9BILA|nr:unnamed protein product [Brachionus calyciflorus]